MTVTVELPACKNGIAVPMADIAIGSGAGVTRRPLILDSLVGHTIINSIYIKITEFMKK